MENDASNKKAKLKLIVLLMSMFLLGLGSDTAFQRWNIIAYFPMGVAVVWPLMRGKSQTVLKKIILTAMPALVLMVPFKSFRMEQASISIKVPKTSKFYGIRMEPYVVEKYYNINELVERLNTKGVSFTFGGLYDRYLYSYEFESDNSLCVPLHMYHWNEGDINLLKRIELKRDVIILGANSKRDCELLKQLYGMEIIESTPSYTVCGDKRIKEILDPSGDFKHLKE